MEKKKRIDITMDQKVRNIAEEMAAEDRRRGISSLLEFLILKEYNERQQKKKYKK